MKGIGFVLMELARLKLPREIKTTLLRETLKERLRCHLGSRTRAHGATRLISGCWRRSVQRGINP